MKTLMLWSHRHPWLVVCLLLAITAFFAIGIPRVRVDASASGMMIQGDPSIDFYNETLERFGSDNVTVIFIKDVNLFTPEKLALLDELHFQCEELAGVDRVESLFSVTNFKGEAGMISTNPLMDYVPETLEETRQVKQDALRNPLLVNNIISENGEATALNLYVIPDTNDPDFVINFTARVEALISQVSSEFELIFQLGNSYTKKSITSSILKDQSTMVPLSVLVLLVLLMVSMRSKTGAILPMITAGSSVVWTAGFMGYAGIPLNILTVIVPSLIVVIGSTEDMHLLSEYVEGLEENKGVKVKAVDYMISKTGTAVLLTALTTFLGFLSITINDITMLKQFGVVASFGLFVNPLVTCMAAPVYLKFFGPKPRKEGEAQAGLNHRVMTYLADKIIHLINSKKWVVFGVLMGGAVFVSLFALNVKVDNDMLGYFKPESDIRVRSEILHEEISGAQVFYIRVASAVPGFFKDPKNLAEISGLLDFMKENQWFDKLFSLTDYMMLIHREMNNGEEAFYRLPDSKMLISQYLLTLQRDEIERYVSPDYSEVNIMIRHNIGSSYALNQAVAKIKAYIDTRMNTHFKTQFTGENILINAAADSIAYGQVKSLGLLLFIIFVIMSVLFVNFKAGFLSLVPNIFPIILVFGVMGLFNIPLNVGTAMVAAIAIGIAVDDTIHFMTRYNKEMKELQDQHKAIEVCIRSEIKPVVATSVALASGFAVVCFSSFVPIVNFGFLSAFVMIFALVGDLFITPILLSSTQLITIWDMVAMSLNKNVIESSPLFTRLRHWQIKRVILLGKVLEIPKGETAISYGDYGHSMFLLLEGSAEILAYKKDGTKRSVGQISPGEVFGEIAMVNPGPRTADIRALSDIKYLEIDWKGMARIQRIYPRIALHLYRNLSWILGTRLKETTIQLMGATK
ncbi:MAG: MMPL family transporter [Desulfotignum sp.]|nr:MMPL family transporter [Desulfotignum sp.]MCF8125125.1 MMPL family transporter [Desulfotignum sp.]